MLAAEQLEVESQAEVQRALDAYARGEGDIADYLIRERALGSGAGVAAGLTLEKLLTTLENADRAASGAEKKIRKVRQKLDCPGFVFVEPERARVLVNGSG